MSFKGVETSVQGQTADISLRMGRRLFKKKDSVMEELIKAMNAATKRVTERELVRILHLAGMARKHGYMRGFIANQLKNQLNLQLGKPRIRLSLEDPVIKKANEAAGVADYFLLHARESTKFKPEFAKGYARPHTPGTHPYSQSQIIRLLAEAVDKEINKEINQRGLR